jgi:hypothetical protein
VLHEGTLSATFYMSLMMAYIKAATCLSITYSRILLNVVVIHCSFSCIFY